MKKILLLFLAAVLTGCGIYLAFYIYGGYREDKEIKDSMKSVELLQSQAVVPEEDTGDGQAPDEPDGNTLSINPGISVDFGVLSDTNPDILGALWPSGPALSPAQPLPVRYQTECLYRHRISWTA